MLNPTPDTPQCGTGELTDALQNNQRRVQLLRLRPRQPVDNKLTSGLLQLLCVAIDAKLCPQVTLGSRETIQFRSVAQSCPTLCDPMNRSMLGLSVHHQLPEFTQTRVHRVSDAIQPSHPLSSPSPPASNPSQPQSFPMSQIFA